MGTLDLRKLGIFGVRLGVDELGMVVGELEESIAFLIFPLGAVVAVCVACTEVVLLLCFCFGLQFSGSSQECRKLTSKLEL